ncbi:MAG: hypothetical protein AAF915_17780 [Cyanobacteria bacterium P01_D01_bin.50]
MAKFTWIKKLLVISIVASVNFPITSNAVTNLVTEESSTNNILLSKKTRRTNNKRKTKSPLDWLRNIFRRKKPKKNNRGEASFCPIWPNPTETDLFDTTNVRIFVWKAEDNITIQKIQIQDVITDSIVWSYDLTDNNRKEQKVEYTGSLLKPGSYSYIVTYEELRDGKVISNAESIDFDVIEQNSINNSKEDIMSQNETMKRTEDFIKKGLVADAIQEVFLLKNASPEWNSGLNEVRNMFCNPQSEQN